METSGIGSVIFGFAIFQVALGAIFNGISLVFAICYAFCWEGMREWFNKKAGLNFMQKDRFETEQGFMIMIGLGIGVLIAIFNMISLDNCVMALDSLSFIGVFVWGFIKFVKERGKLGNRAAFWSSMFNFLANITVVTFAVFFSYIAICIFVVLLLFGGLSSKTMSSFADNSSSDNNAELESGIRGKSEFGEDLILDDCGNNQFRDQHGRDFGRNFNGTYYQKNR